MAQVWCWDSCLPSDPHASRLSGSQLGRSYRRVQHSPSDPLSSACDQELRGFLPPPALLNSPPAKTVQRWEGQPLAPQAVQPELSQLSSSLPPRSQQPSSAAQTPVTLTSLELGGSWHWLAWLHVSQLAAASALSSSGLAYCLSAKVNQLIHPVAVVTVTFCSATGFQPSASP